MKLKRNSIIQLWLPLLVLAIVLISTIIFYIKNLNKNFEQEVLKTMEEISSQEVILIQTEINGKSSLLKDIATVLDIDFDAEPEYILRSVRNQLSPIVKENGFRGMGIIFPDGTAYSTTGDIYNNAMNYQFYLSAMEGNTAISERIPLDSSATEYVNIYTTPILDKTTKEPVAVLFATYRTENFRSTIEVGSFHGEGYSYVVTESGDVVVDSGHKSSFQNMSNVYTSMLEVDEKNKNAVEQLKAYIETGDNGRIIYRNKVNKYMYCRPVGINNWYLLTVVPVNVLNTQMNIVIRNTIVLVVILVSVFGALIGLIVKQQRKKQEELLTLAYVDPITGGHTFAKFQQLFAETLRSYPEQKYALISLDLNKFKMINDLYGYDEGDKIIRNMSRLWDENLRPHEGCGHRMADRFVVLLTYTSQEELKQRVQEYRLQLQETAKGKYKLSLRVGIYQLEENTEPFSTVYSRSMMAFSAAKDSGKHFMAFYQSDMEEQMIWEKNVEDEFQKALKNHEFVVFYQAKIDAESGEISGAEALVRWIKPDGTIIPPNRFIPVLENNGSIAELDQYMFREVCIHQKAWMDEGKK